jgi:hypothetical protein
VAVDTSRLLAAVVVFVFVGVLIVSLAGGEDVGAADRAYLTSVAGPATDSQAVGTELAGVLSRPKLTKMTLDAALSKLIRRQHDDTALASAINPAPRLRSAQLQALDALRLRDSGLTGLRAGFRDAEANPGRRGWAVALAAQADRLVSSDVIWQDLFLAPAQAQIGRDGVQGALVPKSTFLANLSLATAASLATVLGKLEGMAAPSTGASSVLKPGASGPAVKAWQRELNKWLARQAGAKLLTVVLTVDGQYGQSTMATTERFQTAAGIAADGVVGPATRTALGKTLAG